MIKKFVSVFALAGLVAGCGSPLEETWTSTCDNSQISTLKMDGESIDLSVTEYLEPTCKTAASTTKQSGTFEIVKSGKEGVLDQIVVVAGDSLEVTYNTPEDVTSKNDRIAAAKEVEAREVRADMPTRDKANIARSNERLAAVKGLSNFAVGTATKLNRLQAEGMGISPLFAFEQRTASDFVVDNDHLEMGIGARRYEDGRQQMVIFKKSEN